jgi:hypothetical protein
LKIFFKVYIVNILSFVGQEAKLNILCIYFYCDIKCNHLKVEKSPGMVVHACNPSSQEAEAGGWQV